MGNFLQTVIYNTIAALLASGLIYLAGRFLYNVSYTSLEEKGSRINLPRSEVSIPAKRGPLFRSPRTKVILTILTFAAVMVGISAIYPPVKTPFYQGYNRGEDTKMSMQINNKAEIIMRDAKSKKKEVLKGARERAYEIIERAAERAQSLKEDGKEEAAERVNKMAKTNAQEIIERSNKRAREIISQAQKRSEELYKRADSSFVREYVEKSKESINMDLDFRLFVFWILRTLLFLGLVGVSARIWNIFSLKVSSVYSCIIVALVFGIFSVPGLRAIFHFILPFAVASIAYSSSLSKTSIGGNLLSIFNVIKSRFGTAILLVVVQICFMFIFAGTMRLSVIHGYLSGDPLFLGTLSDIYFVPKEYFSGLIGFELSQSISAVAFTSSIVGQSS